MFRFLLYNYLHKSHHMYFHLQEHLCSSSLELLSKMHYIHQDCHLTHQQHHKLLPHRGSRFHIMAHNEYQNFKSLCSPSQALLSMNCCIQLETNCHIVRQVHQVHCHIYNRIFMNYSHSTSENNQILLLEYN